MELLKTKASEMVLQQYPCHNVHLAEVRRDHYSKDIGQVPQSHQGSEPRVGQNKDAANSHRSKRCGSSEGSPPYDTRNTTINHG